MASLREQAISGVKWTGMAAVVSAGLQLVQLAILTRWLAPSDFGLAAIIAVATGFAQTFADVGFSNAIVCHQDIPPEHLSTLYWTNVMAGAVMFVAVALAAPWIARFYHEPRLSQWVLIASLIFLINPFGNQFQLLLQKELRFDSVAKIELISLLGGIVVSVSTAVLHYGVLALILGQLTQALCKAVGFSVVGFRRWRIYLHWRGGDLSNYFQFGLYQMGEREHQFCFLEYG